MKFTPGEWLSNKGDGAIGIYADLKLLVTCWFAAPTHPISEEEAEANARLVLQSPQMHLFLTTFVSAITDKKPEGVWEIGMLLQAKEILKKIETKE